MVLEYTRSQAIGEKALLLQRVCPKHGHPFPLHRTRLDYYLPMLSRMMATMKKLTMQSAGPVREEWQPIYMSYLYQGSEFGHWKVIEEQDAFAFRHPSLAQTDKRQLLDSEAHHHKVCSIGTGRLIALVSVTSAENATTGMLSVMFGLLGRPF